MKQHCPHCARLITLGSLALETATPLPCTLCGAMLVPEQPDAAIADCSCGYRRVVDLKYANKRITCPDCGRQLLLAPYKRPPASLHPGPQGQTPDSDPERRSSARYRVKDLFAYLGYNMGAFPLHDISPAGFSMDIEHSEMAFFLGQVLRLSLQFREVVVVPDLNARVVRCDVLSVGCVFLLERPEQMEQLRTVIRDCVTMLAPAAPGPGLDAQFS